MAFPEITEAYIIEKLQSAQAEAAHAVASQQANLAPGLETKCAAVLLPLLQVEKEWYLLYTRRTELVETHKGQVSFPGGACDPGEEQPEQTALREVEEEIGLRARDVRVLGRLSPLATISGFWVRPVVGLIPWPYAFRVENAEVARVFLMPLAWLADKRNRWEFSLPRKKSGLIVYHPYDGEVLWGATALMTDTFLRVVGLL